MAGAVPDITTIPDRGTGWIPGVIGSNVIEWQSAGLTYAQLLDEAQANSRASEQQASLAADNSLLRVVYGQPRIAAQIANLLAYTSGFTSEWVIHLVWAWGPIDSINDFKYSGLADVPEWALPSWISVNQHYTGSGNTLNSLLVSAFAAQSPSYTFTDTLPNVAHSVVRATSNALANSLDFTARVKGRTVWDPRLSGGTGGTAWSSNPALCLADFIESAAYGIGGTVDDDSLADAADWCDTLIGGKARNTLSLVLAESRPASDWIEVLRTYAECFVVQSNGVYKLIPDKPRSSIYTFSHASNNISSIPTVYKKGLASQPTLVTVGYTDTTVDPYREGRVTAYASTAIENGTGPWRESFVSLPGITDRDEAYRQAATRLNKHRVVDLALTLNAFDEALQLEPGDRVTVIYPPFGISTDFSVSTIESRDVGRWALNLVEYDEAVYSTAVAPVEGRPDSTLPVPLDPPEVTGVTAVQELSRNADGTYSARVRVDWTAATWPYVDHYLVTLRQSAVVIRSEPVSRALTTYLSPPVTVGADVQADVQIVSTVGTVSAVGTGSTDVATIGGKTTRPTDVTNLYGFEAGGKIFLYWQAAIDLDIWRYEIRIGTTSQTWDDITSVFDRVDGLTYVAEGLAAGTWRIHVKALDSQGNYSLNSDYVDIVVSIDAGSFATESRDLGCDLADTDTDYMSSYVVGTSTVYVTDFADNVSYGHVGAPAHTGTFTDNSLGSTPFAHPHTAGTSVMVSGDWDYGVSITGNVSVLCDYTDLSGTATLVVQTKVNSGDAWTTHSSASTSTTFRYLRAKLSTTGTMTVRSMTGKIAVVPRKEMNVASISNTGTTITLNGKYAKYTAIQVTVKNTSGNKFSAIYDNVTLSLTGTNSFVVYVFDNSNVLQASDVSWTFEGL